MHETGAMTLPADRYLDAIDRDSAGLLAAARQAGGAAPVPSCPEWDVADLVWHIGEVHHFWATIARDQLTEWEQYSQPARPDTFDATVEFARSSAGELAGVLRATPPDTPVWTWSSQNDVAWIVRRMAHETAIHRHDAEQSANRDWQLPAELAADGIDEFLTQFLPNVRDGAPPLDGSVHLHCTDTEGEWTVVVGPDGSYDVTRGHSKGTAAIRGPANELLLALWRRVGLDPPIEIFGDPAVATALVTRTDLG
jgi:uncharacterized protein (TIGR03083 family)